MGNKNTFKENLKYNPTAIKKNVATIKHSLLPYYSEEQMELYISHFADEFQVLKYIFPEIDFTYSGRIKNKNSLEEKIYRKLYQGKTGNIYDIYAKKIVIYSVSGKKDEETLKKACYDIQNFLISYSKALTPIEEKCKDYIQSPKSNGYQALHVLRNHNFDSKYCSETQIRTFRMEEYQKFGAASHLLSYKPKDVLRPELCPIFLEIGKNGKTYVLSKEASFKKYKSDYEELENIFKENKMKKI